MPPSSVSGPAARRRPRSGESACRARSAKRARPVTRARAHLRVGTARLARREHLLEDASHETSRGLGDAQAYAVARQPSGHEHDDARQMGQPVAAGHDALDQHLGTIPGADLSHGEASGAGNRRAPAPHGV